MNASTRDIAVYSLIVCCIFAPAKSFSQITKAYKYDALGRLIGVGANESSTTTIYQYDLAGNRIAIATTFKNEPGPPPTGDPDNIIVLPLLGLRLLYLPSETTAPREAINAPSENAAARGVRLGEVGASSSVGEARGANRGAAPPFAAAMPSAATVSFLHGSDAPPPAKAEMMDVALRGRSLTTP